MKNNARVLTEEELKFFNDKYSFEIRDDLVFVKTSNFNRLTVHKAVKGFSLSTSIRKLTISSDAINAWNEHFREKYSLIDVQNAINKLIVMYQVPSIDDLKKLLN